MAFRGIRKTKCWWEEKNKSEEPAELEKPSTSPAQQVYSAHCHCPTSGIPSVPSESTPSTGTIPGELEGHLPPRISAQSKKPAHGDEPMHVWVLLHPQSSYT
ncbi:hypothetical protein STEG23_026905, partial [Scotinomys teguina]